MLVADQGCCELYVMLLMMLFLVFAM